MISIVFAALLIAASASSCSPKFLLPSTIHDTVTLSSFTNSNGQVASSYTYSYFQSLFSEEPKVILSINQLIAAQLTALNYQVTSQIKDSSLLFSFSSKNMSWTSVQLQFLLHSRSDLFSTTQIISISEVGRNKTANFYAETGIASSNSTYVFNHFIIGVASTTADFEINVQPTTLSGNEYSIVVFSNVQATVTIQTVYFSTSQTAFSYAFSSFPISSSQQPQYKALWADFAPTIYSIFGFSKLKGSAGKLSISADLDLVSNIFTVSNMSGVVNAELSYFAIGVLSSSVCAPCNNYISIEGCLDVCPNASYAQSLNGGGKTCRFCNATLGQTLNTQANGCSCSNGLSYSNGNCYAAADLPPKCSNGLLLINKQCVSLSSSCQANEYYDSVSSSCLCNAGFEKVQNVCTEVCPSNSVRDLSSGICVCSAGYLMNSLKSCVSICPQNSVYDATNAKCTCNANFQMVSGACKACTSTEAYDQTSKTCVAKMVGKVGITGSVITVVCQPNEVIVDSKCQCDQNSIKVGGKCTPCPSSTFKMTQVNQCALCPSYCTTCQSNSTCLECNIGFQVATQGCEQVCGDGKRFILPCDDGNTKNGDGCSSTCQIESGYVCNGGSFKSADKCSKLSGNTKISISITPYSPTYTTPGIVTDFVVRPPIKRTHQQLHKMFLISFSNNKARPMQIRLSQSDSDLTSIRCLFAYNSNLPNDIFTATFRVQDQVYGDDSVTIMYNSLTNPVKSAIAFLEGNESDILN